MSKVINNKKENPHQIKAKVKLMVCLRWNYVFPGNVYFASDTINISLINILNLIFIKQGLHTVKEIPNKRFQVYIISI